MTAGLMEKLDALSKDPEFLEGLSKQTSETAMREYLKSKNVEISAEDFAEISIYAGKYLSGELTDEQIEAVSGGFDWGGMFKTIMQVAPSIIQTGVGVYNAFKKPAGATGIPATEATVAEGGTKPTTPATPQA